MTFELLSKCMLAFCEVLASHLVAAAAPQADSTNAANSSAKKPATQAKSPAKKAASKSKAAASKAAAAGKKVAEKTVSKAGAHKVKTEKSNDGRNGSFR